MSDSTPYQATLLLIDDMPDNVKFLFKFFGELKFRVLVAKDGEQGIQTTQYANPDLILLDIMMPDMDGFEVCRRLKLDPNTRDIPIIFMTALSDTVDKIRGFKLGAADYITKPFQQEEVLARVTTHLKLRKRTLELEKRNMELDAFSRTVAHDLKNPLSVVMNVADNLLEIFDKKLLLDKRLLDKLRLLSSSGNKMLSIIDALLLLAGVTQRVEIEMEPLDMSSIVRQVVHQRLDQALLQHPNHIELPDSWPVARGYAPWVEEIWVNYLSNGLKYGGQPTYLQIGADKLLSPTVQKGDMSGFIRFWVRDNGAGLTKEVQSKLFTPFIRLHTERAEGHGLGLSIVQQIVEKLGGKAGVESEIGKGSLFYFTLPIYVENPNKDKKNLEKLSFYRD